MQQENPAGAQVPAQITIPVLVRAERSPVNGNAVTALVTGITGLVLCWVPVLDITLGIVAVVFGAVALHQARTQHRSGTGMAVAGLVTGILTVLAFIVLVVIASGS